MHTAQIVETNFKGVKKLVEGREVQVPCETQESAIQ